MLQVLSTRTILKIPKVSRDSIEFLAINFLFIVIAASFMQYGAISPILTMADAALVVLFVAYWILRSCEHKLVIARRIALHELIALAFTIVFICAVAFFCVSFGYSMKSLLYVPALFLFLTPFYLPALLATFLGVYALRSNAMGNQGKRLAIILFIIAIFLLAFLSLSGYITNRPSIDDEEFLALQAAKATVTGSNPYMLSFGREIYAAYLNHSVSLPTMTTRNNVVGILAYPSLYFLIFVPFAYSTVHGIYAFAYGGISTLFVLLGFAFFLSLAWSLPVRTLKYPDYAIIAFAMMPLIVYSSIVSIAMLAVLILAYSKLNKQYVWLILGVAASLQELLWVPILLMLVYIAVESGPRRALMQSIGALGAFVLINAPFLLLSPVMFLKHVLVPINGYLMPLPEAPMGYLLLLKYPLLLSDMNKLFFLAILASALTFAYLRKKRLLGIFSLMPLAFLYHAIPAYYAFFVSFAVLTTFMPLEKKPLMRANSRASAREKKPNRVVLTSLLLMIMFSIVAVVFLHAAYARYSISMDNVSASSVPGNVTYSADLHYANATGANLSVIAYAYYQSTGTIVRFGTSCDSVLAPANTASSAPVAQCNYNNVNVNLIALRGSDKPSHLAISVIDKNITSSASAVSCALYSSGFFSMCPWVRTRYIN